MTTYTVGPTGDFQSIAAAIATADSGDTIELQGSYTEAGIVSVTKDNLFFSGDTTNTGIHLALASGISTITLLGTAPFRVDDNSAGGSTINGNDGDNTFSVTGTGDHIYGGLGSDTLIADFSGAATNVAIFGGLGNGSPDGYQGTYYNDVSGPPTYVNFDGIDVFNITTGTHNDTVQTGSGNDTIKTGDGNDKIYSGTGIDHVEGGDGTDIWAADMSAQTAAIDIDLTQASSTFLGTGFESGIEQLGSDTGTRQFRTGSGNDTIVTTSDTLDDFINTGGGDDSIKVAGGHDRIDGGTGTDTLIADYSAATTNVGIFGALGAGTTEGYSGTYYDPLGSGTAYATFDNIEVFNITTGIHDDTIETGAGNDTIKTGDGDDKIYSGTGIDHVEGGAGTDIWVADMSAQTSDISIDLTQVSSSFLGTGFVSGIERLGSDTGSHQFKTGSGNDTIVTTSDALDDFINTGAGNDSIKVARGADHVDGGLGTDTLIADYSAFTVNVGIFGGLGAGSQDGYSAIIFDSQLGTPFVNFDNIDVFDITTGSGNDNITTGAGDDILNLGTGNDTAHAAGGTDRLIVDYHASTTTVTMNAPTGTVGAGYSGSVTDTTNTTTFDGIENFTVTSGSGDDSITAGDGDDVLRGGAGADALHGAGGNDTLIAAAGDISSGDAFDGGTGIDTLQVTGTVDFTGAGITSIEKLTFATGGESTVTLTSNQTGSSSLSAALLVTGDANANHLAISVVAGADFSGWTFANWTAGTDTITLTGEAGNDTIIASSQNDTINGGGSNDDITGLGGNDTIDGGSGIDTAGFRGNRADYTAMGSGSDIIITDTVGGRDGSDTLRNMEFVHFLDGTFAINTPPTLSAISAATSTERTFAILDSTATASDAQLDALNSGNGDYSGASLTISRHLGADASDDFGFDASGASFTVVANALQSGGLTFATFTNTAGTLTINFANGGATPTTALVDDVLKHITYANESHNPPAQVTLDWGFSDGETGDFGGALTATQSQTVNITTINDAPVNTVPGAQVATEDTALSISGLSVSDADSGNATITTTLAVAHGTLNVAAGVSGGLTSGQISGEDTATVTLTGTEAQIRATLTAANSVHYTGAIDYNGSDTLTITTNDDAHSGSPTANLLQNGDAEAGVLNGAPASWTPTDHNITVKDYASNFSLTTLDSDAVNGGAFYFTGGNLFNSSAVQQIVDVSGYGTQIDAGLVTANLSGFFGGFDNQNDSISLIAHFLDASSNETGLITIGGVSAADRHNITELLSREGSLLVPVGTRSIEVDLVATRSDGDFDDGYADNLSLTLSVAQTDTDTVAITVNEVNDAPVANNDSLSTIAEDAGVQAIAFTALTGNDLKGPLTATDETTQTLTVTSVSNAVGGTVEITGGHVAFTPTANFNGTASFDYTITDDGTTAGSPAAKTATATASFTVTAANDAPVVTNGTTATLTAVDEDTADPAGATVTTLFGGHFSDAADEVTGGTHADAFAGVAVTGDAATGTEGTWEYFSGGTWNAITSVSTSSALLLDASTQLRFMPAANWNGAAPALTVHLVDNSGGAITTGGTADLTTTGDTTPYSSGAVTLSETVNAVNDNVSATAPATATVAEDSSAAISGLSISDVDTTLAPNGVYQATLTATHGTLTLSTTTNLTFTAGDGTSDTTMTFHGTLADINAALATASYAGDADYNGSASVTFTATDTFNSIVATGSGTASTDTKTVAVTVTAANDTVSASAPGNASLAEDASGAVSGLSIADVDATLAPNGVYEVSLSAGHGTLTMTTLAGLTFTAGGGTSDATMTFHGTLAAINAALATASYAGNANYNGSDTIAFTVTDEYESVVATGAGIATGDSKNIAVTISAVSDNVSASAPATATLAEDSSAAISGLSISDVDTTLAPNGVYEVTLTATHGTLTLSNTTNLTFTAGVGAADTTMTFHGTLADINTALATASYAGDADYNGSASVTFTATDSFNSIVATGSGSASSDTKTVAVTVTAANDPVTASAPATASLAEDASIAISGLSIADLDATLAPNGAYQVTLSASHGAITLSTLTGLTFTAGDGTADAAMTFHGTLAAINAALATASYAGAANYNGSDTIAFAVTDSFASVVATGTGSATSDSKSIAVTISEVNDAPTVAADTLTSVAEDSSQRTILGTTLTGNDSAGPSDESGQTLTVTAVSNVVGGAAVVSGGNVLFTPTANFNGTASFTYTVTDNGTTHGSGDARTGTGTASFAVTAVNDPVTASAPASLSLSEDATVAIGGLSIADIDAALAPNGVYEARLSASHGAISLGTVSGLTFTAGDGTADGAMTFHGTLAAINAALVGATYTDSLDYNGSDTIAFSVTDQFNGVVATGTGSATSDSKSIAVTIAAVNDAPTETVPGALTATSDTDLAITGLSVADVDAGSATVTTTLSAAHGVLSVGAVGAGVSGSGTGTVTLTGTLAAINATLSAANNVIYHAQSGFSGADTLTLATNDGGNTGSGGALTDTHSFAVTVGEIAAPYQWAGSPDLGARSTSWQVAGVGDFNHDGTSDVLWRDSATGHVDEWHMANGQWGGSIDLGSRGLDWQVVGTGDFDNDGTANVLWRNTTTGQLDEWRMSDGQWSGSVELGGRGADWQVAGTGDFNGDGTSDILWRNTTTGQVDEWHMANGNWAASTDLGSRGNEWQVAGTGDFNHDGTSDVLWHNPTTGQTDLWLMSNGNWSSSAELGSFNTAWQIAAVNDFNGDGTTDVLWRNPTTGQVDGWVIEHGNWKASVSFGSLDPAYHAAGSGDFNHDHNADILWQSTSGHVAEWLLAPA